MNRMVSSSSRTITYFCLCAAAVLLPALPVRAADAVRWSVSGPYTQDGKGPQELFDIKFPPEDGKGQWKDAGSSDPSQVWQIDLTQAVGGENRVAYLRTGLKSATQQKATLEIGSDDGVKVWLNGKLVHSNNTLRGVTPGEDKVSVTLKKGDNIILLKITQGGGGWGASFRLAGASGVAAGKAGAGKVAGDYAWDKRPTLEELYAGYDPVFSSHTRASLQRSGRKKVPFSRQDNFMNIGDVRIDAQVWPIITKANQTVEAKNEHRQATELYRRVLKDYQDDLVCIAGEGVFVPASLYVQRKILRYPRKELAYYRILYDPAAKEIFQRAVKRYSIFDYKDLVRFHLATSYGDDALFALGNDAVDKGRYDEARRCYERIVTYHGAADEDRDDIALDRDQVWVRLAICYRHLGRDGDYRAAVGKIRNRGEKTVAELLKQLDEFKFDEFWVRQRENRRSARYDALDDKKLSDPLPYEFSTVRGEWHADLTGRDGWREPEPLPWVTETDIIYKDMNVLYSRSLLTGELNWVFGPGGASADWDFYGGRGGVTDYYPEQSILIHDGVVFAHMFVYGPSLVAVDQYTGRLLWAKGPMAALTEEEWLDRYQASPAPGRGSVIAPVVYDDIRGRSHISSGAELAAFETRTGKLMWRTRLSRISPLKITQSRYPRKIRILSSMPLVHEGVVYHSTNAGIVAAVDALTGTIRWLTRYPQNKTVLDNFSSTGHVWRNQPPVIRGDKLYVTPVDCGHLLCIDKETGRIVWVATQGQDSRWPGRDGGFHHAWRMVGFTAEGLLCLAGNDVTLLDPGTGRKVWAAGLQGYIGGGGRTDNFRADPKRVPKGLTSGINGDGDDFWWPLGHVHTHPILTKDNQINFTMQHWRGVFPPPRSGPFNSEYRLDLKSREIVSQRRWYDPGVWIQNSQFVPSINKRVVNEEPEMFYSAARMTVTRWGIPFEINVAFNRMIVRYDREKLNRVLGERKDLDSLFAKAEEARKRGDVQGAINMYEESKPLLPSEEEDRRRNINLRLYPLYAELARWGHQSADLDLLEGACRKMGATASNPTQEIKALMAYAELHEKRGDWVKAARVLQNASRHYWREPLAVSGLELGDRKKLVERTGEGIGHLVKQVPPLYAKVVEQFAEWERAALDDYFLAVADVGTEYVVETRSVMARRLRELLSRAPREFRGEYEKLAAEELKRYDDVEVGERLLWCWPESEAAKQRIKELVRETASLKPIERQAQVWRFTDLAGTCGLGEKLIQGGKTGLVPAPPPRSMASGAGMSEAGGKNEDPDMVRLTLPQKGNVEDTAHLLFVGGRKKRAYGNRFTILCWNMKENRKEWESREILLHGKVVGGEGFEVGFEEVFIHEGLAIVHGQYDVVALDWRAGRELDQKGKKEKKWHFRVPLGFEIQTADLFGDVLTLCGRGSTVAISPKTGEIVWDSSEMGEFYAGPFFHENVMLTVRKSPAEVSFRKVGSGRLLCRLSLPGLTKNRKHPMYALEGAEQSPAAAEAAEEVPVAFGEGYLTVTDGMTYHAVNVGKRRIEWSKSATKLDTSTDPAYRMWIDGGKLFVLKPYYAVLENAVFDVASGEMLWRRREGGKKMDQKLRQYAGQDEEGGKAATGLILSSMVFIDGIVYGVKYQMGATTISLVGMDPVTGKEVMEVKAGGYGEPEAYVESSWSKDCVVVRVQDGNKFEVWQVDVKEKKIVQKLAAEGYGRLGEYGDASMAWQGPHLALWTFENRKFTR